MREAADEKLAKEKVISEWRAQNVETEKVIKERDDAVAALRKTSIPKERVASIVEENTKLRAALERLAKKKPDHPAGCKCSQCWTHKGVGVTIRGQPNGSDNEDD